MEPNRLILLATSDPEVRKDLIMALEGMKGYSTIWVDNSADLLISTLDSEVGLLVVDDKLNEISFSKLIEIVKKIWPTIPLIVLASAQSMEEFSEVLEHGIYYFIVKPINITEFRQAVESVF